MNQVAFYTLGCKVNQYESYALTAAFEADGFSVVPPTEPADVYIVNSCTVTATGDKKSLQALRRFRRQAPGAIIVLCGCYPQAFPDQAAEITDADIVMGSKNKSAVLQAVRERLAEKGNDRLVEIIPHTTGEPFEAMVTPLFSGRTRAYLKIQDGCEQRCAYCIIPDARGPVRSKPMPALKEELLSLARSGYREVVLVGINLSAYGSDLGLTLNDAIAAANETPGIVRVRLGSLETERLTPQLIAGWADYEKLCPHFHLSLQSGCDKTLAAMRRGYDTAAYRKIVETLREAFPNCAITTDVMVAFPGEGEEDYHNSETFVLIIGFARIHVFVYSPRPGTPAAVMEQLPPEVGKVRAKRLADAASASAKAYYTAQIGSVQPVLFEQVHDGLWQGYTPSYILVKVAVREELAGKILPVQIKEANEDFCIGQIVSED